MTIGYEGLTLDVFFDALKTARVEVIVDVRQMPLSRKKGFSKNSLREAACLQGIEYIHLVEFGCPKAIRNTYKENGDWSAYTRDYLTHLKTLDDPLEKLTGLSNQKRCCLLCYEADPQTCHRLFVAERVIEMSLPPSQITHLPLPILARTLAKAA
jgi:uncharacterized protein (DUF488 family)